MAQKSLVGFQCNILWSNYAKLNSCFYFPHLSSLWDKMSPGRGKWFDAITQYLVTNFNCISNFRENGTPSQARAIGHLNDGITLRL